MHLEQLRRVLAKVLVCRDAPLTADAGLEAVCNGRFFTCKCRSIGQKSTFQTARCEEDAGSFKGQVPTQLQRLEG